MARLIAKYPKNIGRMAFFWYTPCQPTPVSLDPILTAKTKVTRLSQVLVNRLPIKAAARFKRKIQAKNRAASGPVPGIIPRDTPRPSPKAIFWGLSLILASLK